MSRPLKYINEQAGSSTVGEGAFRMTLRLAHEIYCGSEVVYRKATIQRGSCELHMWRTPPQFLSGQEVQRWPIPERGLVVKRSFSWFFWGWRVLSAATAGCCVCEGCSVHCVGLPTVLSRVRLQSSFGFPIAPQTIPSWILLLHVRSHPT